jgi:LAGLIDADG DNA endonuclease family/Homeodomain-like domain
MPQWIHERAEHILAKNPKMREALEGELLGDGSLVVGHRYQNARFQLQAKSRGQVLLAHAALHTLGGEPAPFIRKSSGYRTSPCRMWQWLSHRHVFLTEQHRRWYPNGVKIVPPDFKLTAVSALHWFVGDGSLHSRQAQVILCTDNFDELSIERLMQQLLLLGLSSYTSRTSKGNQRICLSGVDCDKWFDTIGPCVVPDMVHKWSVVPRRYHTKRVNLRERERILLLRQKGLSYTKVAERIGRNISTVWEAVNGRKRRAGMDT